MPCVGEPERGHQLRFFCRRDPCVTRYLFQPHPPAKGNRLFVTDHPSLRTGVLLQSPLLQTLTGVLPVRGNRFGKTARYAVGTRDGDRLVIHDDRGPDWIIGDRVVVLVHGMCSSHSAPYMIRVAHKLVRAGLRTIRVDMRGCGDAQFLSRGHFHAAASDDVADVIGAVRQLSPLSKITVCGFSLGANVVLRMAGLPDNQLPAELDSILAIAPPIDLAWSSAHLRQWGNRIYDHYFTWRLRRSLQLRRRKVPGLLDNGLVRLPSRLVQLDDQFTAPVMGFAGAREYYRAASSAPLLVNIRIPTLIVTAQDDPVIPVEMFRRWPVASPVEIVTPRHGGHLGFLANNLGDPDRHWLDWRIVRWVRSLD